MKRIDGKLLKKLDPHSLLNVPPDYFFSMMGEGFERGGRIRMYYLMQMLQDRKEQRGY